MPNFNIRRDLDLIASGSYFWCSGHLSAVPIGQQSADSRYCRACYNLLTAEADILKETHRFTGRVKWLPKLPAPAARNGIEALASPPAPVIPVAHMATDTATTPVILSHRGRPRKPVPITRIKELAGAGASSRGIARQLEQDGIQVSYRTISRALHQ